MIETKPASVVRKQNDFQDIFEKCITKTIKYQLDRSHNLENITKESIKDFIKKSIHEELIIMRSPTISKTNQQKIKHQLKKSFSSLSSSNKKKVQRPLSVICAKQSCLQHDRFKQPTPKRVQSMSTTQTNRNTVSRIHSKSTMSERSVGKATAKIRSKSATSDRSVSNSRTIIVSDHYRLHDAPTLTFQKIKNEVQQAISNHKTFMLCSASEVRQALVKRGWIEKILINKNSSENRQNLNRMSIVQLVANSNDKNKGHVYKRILQSKLLGSNQCDLIWDPRPFTLEIIQNVKKPVYVNCFRKRGQYNFCSKIGLCYHVKNLPWYYEGNVSDVYFPRTYVLTDHTMDAFIYDYRITACSSLLKWSIERVNNRKILISAKGTVPIDVYYFAILQCAGFIKQYREFDFKLFNSLQTWNKFLYYFEQCVYNGQYFFSDTQEDISDMVNQGIEVLESLFPYRSELLSEGYHNIWILKPDQHNRGEGIRVCKSMSTIKQIVSSNIHRDYIIQKYIERPLLLYSTKFDIRQWFLISSSSPLTVWIYQECYLRFSSQKYELNKFHESIHLTNNSVQNHYRNYSMRNPKLPKNNMWDSETFQSYLKSVGYPNVWHDIVYPKMKQAITVVVLSAREGMEKRQHSFELYGADFLLTPDFQPWLLEINVNPAMNHSTSVTARMCPQVLDNVISVILERDERTVNGKFEMIYKDTSVNFKQPTLDLNTPHLMVKPLTNKQFKKIDSLLNVYFNNKQKHSQEKEQPPTSIVKEQLRQTETVFTENIHNEQVESEERNLSEMNFILTALIKLLEKEKVSNSNLISRRKKDIENTIADIRYIIDTLVKDNSDAIVNNSASEKTIDTI